MNPFSLNISLGPPFLVAATGNPQDMASITVKPKGSYTAGLQNIEWFALADL